MISRQYISEIRLKRDDVPSFAQYPFSLPAVRHLDVLQLHPAVTFFVGENGSGKSTLLEAIAVSFGFNAEGGSRKLRAVAFSLNGYYFPVHSRGIMLNFLHDAFDPGRTS